MVCYNRLSIIELNAQTTTESHQITNFPSYFFAMRLLFLRARVTNKRRSCELLLSTETEICFCSLLITFLISDDAKIPHSKWSWWQKLMLAINVNLNFCRILLFLPMQRRRRQLRKRLLKSEFALPQTLSRFRLIQSRLIRQMLANFFGVEF